MRTLQNIRPTPEQLPILTDDGPGFRLIRGAAGSGKTTAALLRLRQLCASRRARRARLKSEDPVRVLVLTFNRTLRGYINQLATDQVGNPSELHLEVETFSRWALNLLGHMPLQERSDSRAWTERLLLEIGVSGKNLGYFVDEIEYILGRFQPDQRDLYIDATRSGRGRAPMVTQQMRAKLLAEVIQPYEAKKEARGRIDWHDLALAAAAIPSQGYDIVVVDESQDLSANQLRAILAHLAEDHVTTFVIDAMQRIYPQSFQWRELDIEMRPHMVFTLARNHRNTAEIARFASSLVQDLPQEQQNQDAALPDERACRPGGRRPEVLAGTFSAQLDGMLTRIRQFLDAEETVAILHPKGGGWFRHTRQELQRRDIAYCELTGERDWPTGPELVALSTIHSAKGLEFDHVLLPGLNQEVTPHGDEDGDGTLESLRRLVAMAIGRARHTVTLGCKPGERSTLIDLIDPKTYDLVEL